MLQGLQRRRPRCRWWSEEVVSERSCCLGVSEKSINGTSYPPQDPTSASLDPTAQRRQHLQLLPWHVVHFHAASFPHQRQFGHRALAEEEVVDLLSRLPSCRDVLICIRFAWLTVEVQGEDPLAVRCPSEGTVPASPATRIRESDLVSRLDVAHLVADLPHYSTRILLVRWRSRTQLIWFHQRLQDP